METIIHENRHGIYRHMANDDGTELVCYRSHDGRKETEWLIHGNDVRLRRKVGPGAIRIPKRVWQNLPRNVGIRGQV